MKQLLISILSMALFAGSAHAMEPLVTQSELDRFYQEINEKAYSWRNELIAAENPTPVMVQPHFVMAHLQDVPSRGSNVSVWLSRDDWKAYDALRDEHVKMQMKFHRQEKDFLKAAQKGDLRQVQVLLQTGVCVNTPSIDLAGYGITALMQVAAEGHRDLCKFLIDAGANVNATPHDRRTALHRAVINGHQSVCDLLIKAGADMDLTDGNYKSVLFNAVIPVCQEELCSMLVERMLWRPDAAQKKWLYTVMACFGRLNFVERANLKNLFKPHLKAMIMQENSLSLSRSGVLQMLRQLPDMPVKERLLRKYFPHYNDLSTIALKKMDLPL